MGKSIVVTVTVTQPPKPAKRQSAFTEFEVSPTSGTCPLTVRVTGRLIDATGVPGFEGTWGLPDRVVTITVNGSPVTTCTTDSLGYFGTTIVLQQAGSYNIQAEWSGDDYYEGC